MCYSIPKTSMEEQLWNYLADSWGDEEVHAFFQGVSPKVNIVARLEFELDYYDVAV